MGIIHFIHSLKALSFPPETTFCPSGDQSTEYTSSACPGKSFNIFLVAISNNFKVESDEPETINRESPENETE